MDDELHEEVAPTFDTSIQRLTRDLKLATVTLSEQEARYLVDDYYLIQENRIRAKNQVKAMGGEPHAVIAWLFDQSKILEGQIKLALDRYAKSKEIGKWMLGIYGIGPVISAGLIAHIDIKQAPTTGHIWRFAGLDPTSVWEKKKKRPWNAQLKTLCWKIGQSFMKFSNQEECFYGHIYRKEKERQIIRNEKGENAEYATARALKYSRTTEAYKHLSFGKLPPAHIDARARRYAVKLFLAHLHDVWWEMETGTKPPKPYAIAILGHAHYIEPPH